MTTAESLLAPFNWPQVLHPSTRNREDYSVFCLSPWCLKPTDVPRRRDLQVVEPPIGEILSPPGKPTLVYPVLISVNEALRDETSGDSVYSGGDSVGRRRRRQRRGPSPSFAGDQAEASITTTPASVSGPARDTLGPADSGACHVACSVEAAGPSSQAAALEPLLIDVTVAGTVMDTVCEESSPPPGEFSPCSNACHVDPPLSLEVGLGQDTSHLEPLAQSWRHGLL